MKHRPVISPYDKDEYELQQSFIYSDYDFYIVVPAGFVFDGASIPRVLWSTTGSPFLPWFLGPALVHDYLYIHCRDSNRKRTKKEADLLFHKLLRENGVSRFKAWKMLKAVRWFGKGNFK